MESGKLRHYARIERDVVVAVGERGSKISEPQTVYDKVPCEILTLSGKELEFAKTLAPKATVQIRMRYLPNIGPDVRFVWNGRTFNAEHVNNVEQRNRELIVLCVEPVGA